MHHEPLPGLLPRLPAQSHYLQDLGPLLRRVVRALFRGFAEPLGAEDLKLALKQRGVGKGVISVTHHPHKWGRVRQHSRPCCRRGAHQEARQPVRQSPDRPSRRHRAVSPIEFTGYCVRTSASLNLAVGYRSSTASFCGHVGHLQEAHNLLAPLRRPREGGI